MAVRHFKALIEYDPDDKVWVSYVPALDYLSTYGETREEALAKTKEAIAGYLEAAEKEGIPVPADVSEAELVDVEVAVAGRNCHERPAKRCFKLSNVEATPFPISAVATTTCGSRLLRDW